MEFNFLNSKFNLSELNAGMGIENNSFLKKYDTNNNSIFDSNELNLFLSDLKPYVEDGQLDNKESISLYAKIMNMTTSAVEALFNEQNVISDIFNELLYHETNKEIAIQKNLSEINKAIDIYHEAMGGTVSQFCNSIKEIFNTEYAGDRVYRQLAKSKISAMMVEQSERKELSAKEFAQIKIDLLEILLKVDELPEQEQENIRNSIQNLTLEEINKYIEDIANAENEDYPNLRNNFISFLQNSNNNADIGFSSAYKPNSLKSILNSKNDEILDFNQVFEFENGVKYDSENVEQYLILEQNFKNIASKNNEIAHQYESLENTLKNNNLDNLKQEIENTLLLLFDNNTEKINQYLKNNGKDQIKNLSCEDLKNLAEMLKQELLNKLDKILEGKSLDEHIASLENAKIEAFGDKNNIDLANNFAESQEKGVGYVKMAVSGASLVATLCGGPIAIVGVGLSIAGGAGISFIEESSKHEEIPEDIKKEILKELTVSGALNVAGFGSGAASGALYNVLATKCPKLIAEISRYSSDAIMSLLSTYAITGDVDLTGEGISQIINVAVGIATHRNVAKTSTKNAKINSNIEIPVTQIKAKPNLSGIDANYPNIKLLQEIASTTTRSQDEIKSIAKLMEKYPDYTDIIANVVKNKNIKIKNNSNENVLQDIDVLIGLIKRNPEYKNEIVDFMSVQRYGDQSNLSQLNDAISYVSILNKYPNNKHEVAILAKNTNLSTTEAEELLIRGLKDPNEMQDILSFSRQNYDKKTIALQLKLIKKYPNLKNVLLSEGPQYTLIDKTPQQTSSEIIKQRLSIKSHLEKVASKEMNSLKNTLGKDFYDNIKWEDIIPSNANKQDITKIVNSINDKSKFFARTSLNESRYGKNIAWAHEMNNISEIAKTMIKDGASFDEVMDAISITYRGNDLKTTLFSEVGDNLGRRSSGIYRGLEDPNINATTPFVKGEDYTEYFTRLTQAGTRKSPYNDIEITEISYSKNFMPDRGAMIHPSNKYVEPGMAHIRERYDELKPFIEKIQRGETLTKQEKNIIDDKVSEIYFLMANIMPYKRGSNGISDIFMRSIYKSLDIEQPAIKKGISLDLEAFCLNLNDFKKNWSSFFIKN